MVREVQRVCPYRTMYLLCNLYCGNGYGAFGTVLDRTCHLYCDRRQRVVNWNGWSREKRDGAGRIYELVVASNIKKSTRWIGDNF